MRSLSTVLVIVFLCTRLAFAAEVVLKTKWVDDHKNRVTVMQSFPITVDESHKSPNPLKEGSDDGDLHFAGRAPKIGLPMVAEIVNAKSDQAALKAVKNAVALKQSVLMNGVWRLWFEHPSKFTQTQGESVPVPPDTNPHHVFEIHPVTEFGANGLQHTFFKDPAYTSHPAAKAFKSYERLAFTVKRNQTFTSITAKKAVFNYADFVMVVAGSPKKSLDGGVMVLATIEDLKGNVLVATPRRMVAAPNTGPAQAIENVKKGVRLRVLGIPRVNLERLMTIAENNPGTAMTVTGAYEMILVGIEKP